MLLRVLSSTLCQKIVSPALRTTFNRNLFMPRLHNNTAPTKFQVKNLRNFIRKYADEPPKEDVPRSESRGGIKERMMAPPSENAYGIGKGALAGAGAIGLGALCFYGIGLGKEQNIYRQSKLWAPYVRERVHSVYAYFGGACAITAASAYLAFQSPAMMNFVSNQGWMAAIATFALMIGSGILTQSIPYKPGVGPKQLAWAAHCAIMGAIIAPICILGGPIMSRAALYTAGLVGGLSAIAVSAPSDKFLFMGGPLAIGLGILVAASLANMWLPPSTAIGAGLHSLTMYGGLILFSVFLLFNTQRIVRMAEIYPQNAPFDPVNASLSIYMDTLNIFIRIAMILASNSNTNNPKSGGKSKRR